MQDIPGNKAKYQYKANDDAVGHANIDIRHAQKAVAEGVDHVEHGIDFGYALPEFWEQGD